MKKIKNSVAFIIYNEDRTKVLLVLRPEEDIPSVWGLPAGSLKEGESFEDAVLRSGIEKLGVKLKVIKEISEGQQEREKYILNMKEFEVEILEGEPKVPQPFHEITQYLKIKWGEPKYLIEAKEKGSLCAELFLESI